MKLTFTGVLVGVLVVASLAEGKQLSRVLHFSVAVHEALYRTCPPGELGLFAYRSTSLHGILHGDLVLCCETVAELWLRTVCITQLGITSIARKVRLRTMDGVAPRALLRNCC
jgi:hypothetical protein